MNALRKWTSTSHCPKGFSTATTRTAHVLNLVGATDVRRVTGYQDFADSAPMELILCGRLLAYEAGTRRSA